tara:strand:+ start:1250 stop:1882 length:633 start_codon:yes stop_codon:yes gene_type:complete
MRNLIGITIALIFFTACKKDDDSTSNKSASKNSYFPLKIGNYWVYENYEIDANGTETKTSQIDMITIERDTIIKGNKYYVLEGTQYPLSSKEWKTLEFLRDSSGYIVDNDGRIHFSKNNFTDVLLDSEDDSVYIITYQMEELVDPITVSAGQFEVLNYRGTYTSDYFPDDESPRYIDNYYAKGVGKILYSWFYVSQPTIYEKRLVSYYVE